MGKTTLLSNISAHTFLVYINFSIIPSPLLCSAKPVVNSFHEGRDIVPSLPPYVLFAYYQAVAVRKLLCKGVATICGLSSAFSCIEVMMALRLSVGPAPFNRSW